MAPKFFSKMEMDGNGGGSTSFKRPTMTELLHKANLAIYFMHDGEIQVLKDRYSGKTGKISSEEFLSLMLKMLAEKVYQGNAKMFQEGLIQQLEPMIKKVLQKNKVGVRNDDTL